MMFPRYPNYKASDVSWLGIIPADWKIKKFRYVFEESPEKISDQVVGDMLSVSGYRGIEVKQYQDEGRRRTDEELFGYRVVRPGQLVVNTMWLNYAGLGVSEHEGHVSPAYRSYWIDPLMDKRFIHHLMRSGTYVQGYTQLLTGIRPNSLQMGRDDLMGFPVLLPAKSEQTQIARFLDHETARIDALIEEQQRLIELLKEKRQAVISHAVMKGLDPTVPMKDSGVEWLGEVPAHWGVKALRYLGECQNGINIGGEAFGSGSPFVSYGDVYKNDVLPTEVTGLVQSSPEDQQRYSIEYGDVFFTRTSETVDEIGFSATCLQELPNAVFAGFLIRFRPTGKSLAPGFSKYYFRNQGLRIFFNKEMNLVTRASLSQDLLKLLPVTIPPVVEQIKISDFLDRVTAEFAS